MYDCTTVCPFLDGPAFRARKCNVDFDAEFHQFGGLRRGPASTVGSLCDVEHSHFYRLCAISQRCVQSRMCL
jgi:hypothetical protein